MLCRTSVRPFNLTDPPVRFPNLNRVVRRVLLGPVKRLIVILAFDDDRQTCRAVIRPNQVKAIVGHLGVNIQSA